MRYFELASGTGAHPSPATAAQRAVLEAAQTRLTIIAGARDDLAPGEYQRPLPPDLALFTQAPAGRPYRDPAHGPISGALTAPRLFDWIVDRLKQAGIQSAVLVPFESEDPDSRSAEWLSRISNMTRERGTAILEDVPSLQ